MKLNTILFASGVGLAAAVSSGGAAAQNYFSVHGAYTIGDETDFQVAPGTIDTEFDAGWGLGAAFGTHLGAAGGPMRWRVEGEIAWRTNDVDSHSLNGGPALPGATGEIDSTSFMLNALMDFDTGSAFTPYLGGGIGLAQIDASGFGVAPIPDVLDDDDTVLAYQLIGGVGYSLNPSTDLFIEYRYFGTEDADVTTSVATGAVNTSIDYQDSQFLAGARFRF